MITEYPLERRRCDQPEYEPFWAAAQALDLPLSLHTAKARSASPVTEQGGVAHVLITQQLRQPEHQELLPSGLRIAMGQGLHQPDPLLRAADL